jgi:hypothetical protein
MNVYAHVAMNDLHVDVESLPGLPGNGNAQPQAKPIASATSIPGDPAEAPAVAAMFQSSSQASSPPGKTCPTTSAPQSWRSP